MKPLTLVLPYYDNPDMFREQQRRWRALEEPIKAHLSVVVVDDASPRRPAQPEVEPTGVHSFRLFRTGVDIPWNWQFARNLGVEMAETEWLVLTDIDHVVPAETFAALVGGDHDPDVAYRFARVKLPDLTAIESHRNTWFLTKAMYDRIGGYDERLAGYHGGDAEFFRRAHQLAQRVEVLADVVIRVPRRVIGDSSTTSYRRDRKMGRAGAMRLRLQRWRDPNPRRLSCPYERLL